MNRTLPAFKTYRLSEILLVAVLYFIAARLGQLFAIAPGNVTPVWLPSGLMVALAYIRGPQIWPGVFLGAFSGNVWAYFSLTSMEVAVKAVVAGICNGVGDVLSTVVVVQIIRHLTQTLYPLGSFKDFALFFVLAVIAGPAMSALFGVTSLVLCDFLGWENYLATFATWWTGDGVGTLIIAPLILSWQLGESGAKKFLSIPLSVWLPLFSGILSLALFGIVPVSHWTMLLCIAVSPALLLVNLHTSQSNCFSSLLVMAAIAIYATASGLGPFGANNGVYQLIELQLFLAVVACMVTLLSITFLQRRRSLEKIRTFLNNLPHGVQETDIDGYITYANSALARIFGAAQNELIGRHVTELSDDNATLQALRRYFSSVEKKLSTQKSMTLKSKTLDGRQILLRASWDYLLDYTGEVAGYISVISDITEKTKNEEKLIRSEANLAQAQQIAHLGSWELNLQTNRLDWSDEVFRIFEIEQRNFAASYEAFLKVIHPEDREFVDTTYKESLKEQGSYNIEHRLLMGDGRVKYVNERCETVWDENGNPIRSVGTVLDITERVEAEKKILQQANYDVLTNLPNRFLSLDRLSQLLKESQRNNTVVAVVFVDLDDFKKINDSLGHESGDKLLVDTARRIRASLRSTDTVGRLGGDEFIILLSGLCEASAAQGIVENLLHAFKAPYQIEGRELILSASAGIAVYPGDGSSASELLRNADSAMYHAKRLGRNTYCFFTDEMNQEVSRRLAIEEQISGALERGEFSVVYQPQVSVDSELIVGAEALIRWHNPALGFVPPDEFIPIAEQTGIIVTIGEFVLSQALQLTRRCLADNPAPFRIAVNLSPRQFRDPDLVASIAQQLSEHGIPPGSLELEITEGVLMSGHRYIDEALNAISGLGVALAMDDFGTGYSSLSYLRNYPFNALKVDRSFIGDINKTVEGRELVNAAVAMAHALEMEVVAEGVETEQQLAILKDLQCDFAQGYLFSKPVSEQEFYKMRIKKSIFT